MNLAGGIDLERKCIVRNTISTIISTMNIVTTPAVRSSNTNTCSTVWGETEESEKSGALLSVWNNVQNIHACMQQN